MEFLGSGAFLTLQPAGTLLANFLYFENKKNTFKKNNTKKNTHTKNHEMIIDRSYFLTTF